GGAPVALDGSAAAGPAAEVRRYAAEGRLAARVLSPRPRRLARPEPQHPAARGRSDPREGAAAQLAGRGSRTGGAEPLRRIPAGFSRQASPRPVRPAASWHGADEPRRPVPGLDQ